MATFAAKELHMYKWGDNRRFNSYAGYIKRKFGGRVQKLTLDAGFTCPNRDGTISIGGCAYCNNDSFNPNYCTPSKSITQQLNEGIDFHNFRYRRVEKYLAYFQAFSNTYAPLPRLKELYGEALSHPKVNGLVVGTRPDCIDEEKLDYLAELAKDYYVSVEYGVESCYNRTLKRINRGHDFEKSVWAIEQTARRGLNVGAHFIIGLPGESRADLVSQTEIVSQLPLTTIKFHQLQIVRNTSFALEYEKTPEAFNFFGIDEYLELMVEIVERLTPSIVIERFTGEASPKTLIAPIWGKYRSDQLLQKFENLLEQKDTWQGKFFSS
ncbi:MAG: TIGR01212 family radical SAM protein [Tenuifilaceae bacterium]|jgi:radical SAM protein (TIGR01212 family)|nr:TIGR01212 family radical SAM protein [Tenuifilaceae bacterium]